MKLRISIIGIIVSLIVTCCAFGAYVEDDYSTGYLQYRVGDVIYGAAECGHMSRYVLQNLADDAQAGVFDWSQMNSATYRNQKLSDECQRLRSEVNYRQYNHNRDFPRRLYDN